MKTDEIKWRILNDTAENVVKWIAEKDKRNAELEAEIDEVHATGGCSYIRLEAANKRIKELEAILENFEAYSQLEIDKILQGDQE